MPAVPFIQHTVRVDQTQQLNPLFYAIAYGSPAMVELLLGASVPTTSQVLQESWYAWHPRLRLIEREKGVEGER